jgi:hypothetical protein
VHLYIAGHLVDFIELVCADKRYHSLLPEAEFEA